MIARLKRLWTTHRPRIEPPEMAAVRLRALAARIEEALDSGGALSLDYTPTTETGRPTMDLDLDSLIARWRRLAAHVRTNNPGQLTPADVYEHCADALEARMRTRELQQQQEREEAVPA